MGFEGLLENTLERKHIESQKGTLFEAIFGSKLQSLFDKITKFLSGEKSLEQQIGQQSTIAYEDTDKTESISHYQKTSAPQLDTNITHTQSQILGDMTYLADTYEGQAWAKNNNPSGITWNEKFANPTPGSNAYAFLEAGIRFEKGTPRPQSERIKKGGNSVPTYYVKFATMDDGLRAKKIMLERSNDPIRERLAKWVGTKNLVSNYAYADQILREAGIDGNKRFAELSESQKDMLMMKQIKKESGGLYKELIAKGITPIASNIT